VKMFCSNCGRKDFIEANFCIQCGFQLQNNTEHDAAKDVSDKHLHRIEIADKVGLEPYQNDEQEVDINTGYGYPILIGATIGLVLSLVLWLVFQDLNAVQNSNSSSTSSSNTSPNPSSSSSPVTRGTSNGVTGEGKISESKSMSAQILSRLDSYDQTRWQECGAKPLYSIPGYLTCFYPKIGACNVSIFDNYVNAREAALRGLVVDLGNVGFAKDRQTGYGVVISARYMYDPCFNSAYFGLGFSSSDLVLTK
jgi:hypothetical protein